MRSMAEDFSEASAYLDWQANPCGKPPLILAGLKRHAARLDGVPCLAVDCSSRPVGTLRRAALTNLEGAYHHRRDFPGTLSGYFEGFQDGLYMIEIYGAGEPWPVKDAPPRPAYMGPEPKPD